MNAEIEKLLHNYKQGDVIIPSFFKKLNGGLNSPDRISLLSVLAPGNTETEGNLKEEKLGTHGSKEQAEERLQALSGFKMFFFFFFFFKRQRSIYIVLALLELTV